MQDAIKGEEVELAEECSIHGVGMNGRVVINGGRRMRVCEARISVDHTWHEGPRVVYLAVAPDGVALINPVDCVSCI
jgi:hypothetical protein